MKSWCVDRGVCTAAAIQAGSQVTEDGQCVTVHSG